MLDVFQLIGRDLFQAGINNSHSGNLSYRLGDRLVITRTGSMLGHLQQDDLIETGIFQDDENTAKCSSEVCVHRAIYKHTDAMAIVHAHPVYATALSLLEKEIIPLDAEGAYYFGKVPVIEVQQAIGSMEVAEKVPTFLQEAKIVMVKGHGSFAATATLEEGFKLTTTLENCSKIAYFTKTLLAATKA